MSAPGASDFPTTSWSLIRRAANLEVPDSRAALASLANDPSEVDSEIRYLHGILSR